MLARAFDFMSFMSRATLQGAGGGRFKQTSTSTGDEECSNSLSSFFVLRSSSVPWFHNRCKIREGYVGGNITREESMQRRAEERGGEDQVADIRSAYALFTDEEKAMLVEERVPGERMIGEREREGRGRGEEGGEKGEKRGREACERREREKGVR